MKNKILDEVGLFNLLVDNLLCNPGKPVMIVADDFAVTAPFRMLKSQVYSESGWPGLFASKIKDPLWGVNEICLNGTKIRRSRYPQYFEHYRHWPEFMTADIFLLSLVDTEDEEYHEKFANLVDYASWLADNRMNKIFYWAVRKDEVIPEEVAAKFEVYTYKS